MRLAVAYNGTPGVPLLPAGGARQQGEQDFSGRRTLTCLAINPTLLTMQHSLPCSPAVQRLSTTPGRQVRGGRRRVSLVCVASAGQHQIRWVHCRQPGLHSARRGFQPALPLRRCRCAMEIESVLNQSSRMRLSIAPPAPYASWPHRRLPPA